MHRSVVCSPAKCIDREFLLFIGQVREMVSEEEQRDEERPKMSHLMIPAAYSSGVTLFALRDSDVGRELLNTSELPLL